MEDMIVRYEVTYIPYFALDSWWIKRSSDGAILYGVDTTKYPTYRECAKACIEHEQYDLRMRLDLLEDVKRIIE